MKATGFVIAALFSLTTTTLVMADASHHGKKEAGSMGHANSGMMMKKKGGHGGKKGPVHLFSASWVKTLTDQQKLDFDAMHLKVGQFEVVEKAKAKVLKAELAVIAGNTPANQKAMYDKIDKIMAIEKSIMRNRYDHIAEMREGLTPEQRISYDAGLLKTKKHKH